MQFLIVSSSDPGSIPTSFLINCSCRAVLPGLMGAAGGAVEGGGWLNMEGKEVGGSTGLGFLGGPESGMVMVVRPGGNHELKISIYNY